MRNKVSITPFLWFDKEAGEAAELYTSVFPNSKILNKDEIEGTPSGEVHIYKVELSGAVFQSHERRAPFPVSTRRFPL
jgi:predicted 3-demethylubiquinone-9 3-methyltransferase (glyoxalase superfamily)